MKTALEYLVRGDGLVPRGFRFDIHDNLKDIADNQGTIDSATAAAQSYTGSAISSSTAPISASDEAVIQNSGNTSITNNVLDAGAIAAAADIAKSGITADSEAFQAANTTVQDALEKNSELAKQTGQGEVVTFIKPLAVLAGVLFGLWVLGKVLLGAFTGKKKEATT